MRQLPLPIFPELPDRDPIRALRLLRDYVREVINYFSPVKITLAIAASVAILILLSIWVAGADSTLQWASDFVPLLFTVVGIIVSIKKLRDEHQSAVIVIIVAVGILGTVVLHLSRIHEQSVHATEVDDLKRRMDSVGTQNNQLLAAFLTKAPLTSQEAEMERRQNIQKALRSEYILSHSNVSPGLLAGTEFPPPEWMNQKLQLLGEKWTFASPPSTSAPREQSTTKPDIGLVVVNPTYPYAFVISLNGSVAHEITVDPILFDLDDPNSSNSLFINESKLDWIGERVRGTTLGFVRQQDVGSRVKPGHRLSGCVTVLCPLCIRSRAYWLYITWGQGGWYSELPEGQAPSLTKLSNLIPQIRDNLDQFLSSIAVESRKLIQESE